MNPQALISAGSAQQTRKLLIVDDEPDYADSLGNILAAEGYNVKIAYDLELAEKILGENTIDLALIDIRLGPNNGIDFVADCQNIRPQLACILITGHASVKLATQAFHSGAHDFLQKSIDIDELLIALERCYQRIKLTREKIETELKLAESNERFRSSFESTSISMILADLDGTIKQVNNAACILLGYAESELLNLNFLEIVHPDEIEKVLTNQLKINAEEIDSWRLTKRLRHNKGHHIWTDVNFSLARKTDKNPAYIIIHIVDITRERKYSEELSYLATHDSLTKLLNRREFEVRLQRVLDTVSENTTEHVLCYIDLDRFKVVNDTCGHAAGDEMLRKVSELMQNMVRARDTIARLGGDEFGILMEHCSVSNALRTANSLLDSLQQFEFSWELHKFNVGASIGLVTINTEDSATELIKAADAACYKAKEQGRNRVCVYETDDASLIKHQEEIAWISQINSALEQKRFCLYAQFIAPLNSSSNQHYEILVRLIDEAGKIILPGAFLPTAERYNLITAIDRRIIEMSFDLLANNPEFLRQIDFISINLSGHSMADSEFLEFVIAQFSQSKIDGGKICFEITETAAISNLSKAIKLIATLKELGCRFALDDFGSGLSSFAYLKNLPVDYLKIDGIFIKDIVDDPISHAMVKSINEIGHLMGMQTIAEYVENDEIKDTLIEIGIDYAQGYSLGKPQPFADLIDKSNNIIAKRKR